MVSPQLNVYKDKWKDLPFTGFGHSPVEQIRRQNWEQYAVNILDRFDKREPENVSLIADTGAGKTVIAHLVVIASGMRTLFLVPQRALTYQHQILLDRMSDSMVHTRSITGLNKQIDRVWNDDSDQIVFATPHIFVNDLKRGIVDINSFKLVIIDEFHKATGDYPYVFAADTAYQAGLKILALSASPGGDLEKVETVHHNCHIKHSLRARIETPPKSEHLEVVPICDKLKQAEEYFLALLSDTAIDLELGGFVIDRSRVLTVKELNNLHTCIQGCERGSEYYEAISAYAKYMKLRHAFGLMMSESYGTFLKFVEKLKKDKSNAARRILKSSEFHQLVLIADANSGAHPKVNRLMGAIYGLASKNHNALIFVAYKDTAKYLAELIKQDGLTVEVVFGGRDKDLKHQQEVMDRISRRDLDFVLATSVVEEGINVPEVDAVIHYSMPVTEVSRLQRSGRTGRLQSGEVIYIAMDHFLDRGMYWGTRQRLQRMRQLIDSDTALASDETKQPTSKYRHKIDQTVLLPFR